MEATPLSGLSTLAWISEQYAVRLDQLAQLLGVTGRAARAIADRLVGDGLVERGWFLVDQPSWLWLTAAGQRAVGNGLAACRPRVGSLAHIAAVNDVRLHVERHAPGAEWICERALIRGRHGFEHLPDAVVLVDDERHAIEVELTIKATRRLEDIVLELSGRFDRVVYFAAPEVKAKLRRMGAQARYPKLVVRDLAAAPGALA